MLIQLSQSIYHNLHIFKTHHSAPSTIYIYASVLEYPMSP